MADSCFDKNVVSASIKRRFVKIKRRFILPKGRFGNPNRRDFVTFAKKGRATCGKGLCLYEVYLCCCGVMFFEKQR